MGLTPALKARILTKRADFLRIKAAGVRVSTPSFTLQALPDDNPTALAIGFTCAKRTFRTSVASNRGRRRLKAAWQRVAGQVPAGFMLVLVGKTTVLTHGFAALVSDLQQALTRLPVARPTAPPSATGGVPQG